LEWPAVATPLPADDDLLQPSLEESSDPVRMRAAWSPWQLAVLAVLGGPLTAGYLYGDNFRRLGRKPLLGWCVLGALVLAVATGLVVGELVRSGSIARETDAELRSVRLLARGATMLAILPIAYVQQRRFRVFTVNGGEPGMLWKAGLAAVFVGGTAGNYVAWQVLKWTT
jgi:hypothetical protein